MDSQTLEDRTQDSSQDPRVDLEANSVENIPEQKIPGVTAASVCDTLMNTATVNTAAFNSSAVLSTTNIQELHIPEINPSVVEQNSTEVPKKIQDVLSRINPIPEAMVVSIDRNSYEENSSSYSENQSEEVQKHKLTVIDTETKSVGDTVPKTVQDSMITVGDLATINDDEKDNAKVPEVSPNAIANTTTALEEENNLYQVKWIQFGLRETAIITQNENGPCPLISIVNILLLRGKLLLPEDCEMVSSQQLLEYLGDLILNLSANNPDPDLQRNINDAVSVLPKLSTGLDVNVKFTGVNEFEYTPEMLIFDILHINIYHGWLVDPQMEEIVVAVNSLSYNQLVEKIISNTGSEDSELYSQSLLAQQFLENSAAQLTYHGLYELNTKLEENNLAVFFRNNHFSTIYKKNGELFLLVTDQGFLRQKDVVWETLGNIEGDGHFVNHLFQDTEVEFREGGQSSLDPVRALERDSALAARLQEVEDRSLQSAVLPEQPIGPRSGRKDKNCTIL